MSDSAGVIASWIMISLGPHRQHDAMVIYQVESDIDGDDVDDAFAFVAGRLAGHNFHRVTADQILTGEWPRGHTGAVYLTAGHLAAVIIGDISLTPHQPIRVTGQWTAAGYNQGRTVILALVRAGSLSAARGDFTTAEGMTAALTDLADRRGLLAARVDLVTVPTPTEGPTT